MNTLISIITPCFNSKDYIERCILSVLSQTYKNIEYIVIDGGSTDGTIETLEKYKNRIKYISEKDNGNYDAIKKGFSMAKGEILSWIDSDNYYYSNDVIEKIIEKLALDKSDLIITNAYSVYSNSKKIELVDPTSKEISSINLINKGNYFKPECTFYKKELYDKSEGLDLKYKLLADYDLLIKILRQNPKISKLKIVSAVYEIRPNALLRKYFFQSWKDSFEIGRKYNRKFTVKIKFYLLFFIATIRYFLVSLIKKNKKLENSVLKIFK